MTHTITINQIEYNIEGLENDIWNRLLNGTLKSKHPFHTASVATMGKNDISLRTVVLRKVIPYQKEIRFHTDIRSPKWTELTENQTISLLLYDSPSRIQLRIKGKSELHYNNQVTELAWNNTRLSSRKCYLSQFNPSSLTDQPCSGLSPKIELEQFTLEESEVGKQNFGVVAINVVSIDWLWLHHAGHRRALFNYATNSFQWLIP